MTVLIGARLDDGRKVIVADGAMTNQNDDRIANNFVKIRRVTSTVKSRTALVAVAGKPSELPLFADVVHGYLTVPEPHPEDLFYRLHEKYKSMGVESKSGVIVWLPEGDDHVLVHITSDFCVTVVTECNFVTEGSGGPSARAALLGLAHRGADELRAETRPFPLSDVVWRTHLSQWKPSEYDVTIGYDVACQTDSFCGGSKFCLTL